MTECTQASFDFPPVKRRRIEARFSGGDITSDGGLLLLRQADRRLGLLEAINARLPDPRDGRYVRHDQLALLRQRVYALCQGYEDLNDHDQLRGDLALQTATEQDQVLGSSPTLCRLKNHIKEQQLGLFADRTSAHQWWTNQFRLLLSSLAYMLMETIRRRALHDTELAYAQVGTLRLKLLKIGAIILRNTRRIRFLLSSTFPYQNLFYAAAKRLVPG